MTQIPHACTAQKPRDRPQSDKVGKGDEGLRSESSRSCEFTLQLLPQSANRRRLLGLRNAEQQQQGLVGEVVLRDLRADPYCANLLFNC